MTLFQEILRNVPFDKKELVALIATAQRRYKIYQIPKRDKKAFRTIAQPAPEVKLLQQIILEKYVANWPVHNAATAYRPKTSIAEHVTRHIHSRYLLKLDFSNFFPSITAENIRQHARIYSGLLESDIGILVNILAWRNKLNGEFCLSIGAPSSPAVSNSIMYEFDKIISAHCLDLDVNYSRYADDLAFSTHHRDILTEVQKIVNKALQEIEYPRLFINEKKTINVSKRHNRTLVGLTITSDEKLSLGRDRKKDIRARLYFYGKGYLQGDEVAHLRGLLAFAWSIEPGFVIGLAEKQGNELFEQLGLPFRHYSTSTDQLPHDPSEQS